MGHRANFVVIRSDRATAFYDQWAALGSAYGLADGPDQATAIAEGCEVTDELLNWAFAEAGYLIDHDRKVLITFGYPEFDLGGEGSHFLDREEASRMAAIDAALMKGPRAFLEHIAANWTGWELQWDDRGVDAFAEYLRDRRIDSIGAQQPEAPPDRERHRFQA